MEVLTAVIIAVVALVALAFLFVVLVRATGFLLALIGAALYLTPIVGVVVVGLGIWASSKATGNVLVAVGLVGGLWWITHLMKDGCKCPLHRFDARLADWVEKLLD